MLGNVMSSQNTITRTLSEKETLRDLRLLPKALYLETRERRRIVMTRCCIVHDESFKMFCYEDLGTIKHELAS